MENKENYSYRCVFKKEILVNREQEYIRRKKSSDIDFEYYSEDFEDTDFQDAKRWIKDTTTSFYTKTLEEIQEHIRFEFHNGRIDTTPIIEDGYFYWFDNNCLVKDERILHRARLDVDYASDIEITNKDLIKMANKIDI